MIEERADLDRGQLRGSGSIEFDAINTTAGVSRRENAGVEEFRKLAERAGELIIPGEAAVIAAARRFARRRHDPE